jgi:hypothetical protein
MPSFKTKSQKRRDGTNAKAKDYYMKKRRAKIGNKKLWLNAFIGSIPICELYKCFNIIP